MNTNIVDEMGTRLKETCIKRHKWGFCQISKSNNAKACFIYFYVYIQKGVEGVIYTRTRTHLHKLARTTTYRREIDNNKNGRIISKTKLWVGELK